MPNQCIKDTFSATRSDPNLICPHRDIICCMHLLFKLVSFTFVSLIFLIIHLNHTQKYKRFWNILYHSHCSLTALFWVMKSINLFGTFICKTKWNTVSLHHTHTTLVCWRGWHPMPDSPCNIQKQLKLGTWTLQIWSKKQNIR